jgi:DNA-binding response OmpR family regulator
MRITVVSASSPAEAVEILRDLGCAVRESSPLAPPAEVAARADIVLVETGDDAEVGRFVLGRLRGLDERVPAILALRTSQLTRVDPAWGHDDMVLQPYVPQELYVRLRAVEWKTSEFDQPERIKLGDLVIDPAAHVVTLAGRRVTLAPMEFTLLTHLARHRARVLRRDALLRDVWGVRGMTTRTVDVHIQRLRARFEGALHIETVRGVGYRLVAPSMSPPINTDEP